MTSNIGAISTNIEYRDINWSEVGKFVYRPQMRFYGQSGKGATAK